MRKVRTGGSNNHEKAEDAEEGPKSDQEEFSAEYVDVAEKAAKSTDFEGKMRM